MKYLCVHVQSKERLLLKEKEALDLDKRIWEISPYTNPEFELVSFIVNDDFFICIPIEMLP